MKMDEMLKNGEGGYVFISHSHQDIKEVRKIRNVMEEHGFEPLCFYLRCLSDDDEIEGIIKREIDSREWFVYIDSANARKSKWVQKEREYIKNLGDKKILEIDLDCNDAESISDKIMKSMRVFVSYSIYDSELARRICNKFIERDLRVFYPDDSMPEGVYEGEGFAARRFRELNSAALFGCVVVLFTKASIASEYIWKEMEFSCKNNARIIPVFVDIKCEELNGLEYYISKYQGVFIDSNSLDTDIDMLVDKVEKVLTLGFYVNK